MYSWPYLSSTSLFIWTQLSSASYSSGHICPHQVYSSNHISPQPVVMVRKQFYHRRKHNETFCSGQLGSLLVALWKPTSPNPETVKVLIFAQTTFQNPVLPNTPPTQPCFKTCIASFPLWNRIETFPIPGQRCKRCIATNKHIFVLSSSYKIFDRNIYGWFSPHTFFKKFDKKLIERTPSRPRLRIIGTYSGIFRQNLFEKTSIESF